MRRIHNGRPLPTRWEGNRTIDYGIAHFSLRICNPVFVDTVYRDHKVLSFSWSMPNEEFSSFYSLPKHTSFKCPENVTKSEFCTALEHAWQTQPSLPPADFITQNDCDLWWNFAMTNVQNMFTATFVVRTAGLPKNPISSPFSRCRL